ncbi:MAG: hypothetical protein J6L69_00475 [Lachnospiraceae bacterium]|nr:hypothetical protein [Lachnospiraceae bacterium]
MKKLVIAFPGIRGNEIPLLYFGAKHYEDMGYESIFISNPICEKVWFDEMYENAEKIIKNIDFSQYEHIVFVAKSMGTVVACTLKEEYDIKADLILFTPLKETLPFMKKDNDIILVAAGDEDTWLDTNTLVEVCENEGLNYYIEHGVGHRMEVAGDLKRNLEVLEKVIGRIE